MTTDPRDKELEARLTEIGERLAYPPATGISAAVRARLREPRRSWWEAVRSPRFAFVPAVATLALLLLVVVATSPDARAAASSFLRLRGIDIFPVATIAPRPSASAVSFPGERVSLEEAQRRAAFPLKVPTDPRLGQPDEVRIDSAISTQRVTLIYARRPSIPVSAEAGVSAVVVEFRGAIDATLFGKAAGPGTRIESVFVNGSPGYWLEGQPHLFFWRDRSGNILNETLRLAGNTLLWEQDGVTYRLEAQVTKDDALRIAASFR